MSSEDAFSPCDVFISHSSKDKLAAEAVCKWLERNAVRCWIAPRDIQPGADWGKSIVDGIQRCGAVLLIFSGHSNSSRNVSREIERATSYRIPIVPLRIANQSPDGSLEYHLATVQWLDAYEIPIEDCFGRVLETVRPILSRRGPSVVDAARLAPVSAAAQENAGAVGRAFDKLVARTRAPWLGGAFLLYLISFSLLVFPKGTSSEDYTGLWCAIEALTRMTNLFHPGDRYWSFDVPLALVALINPLFLLSLFWVATGRRRANGVLAYARVAIPLLLALCWRFFGGHSPREGYYVWALSMIVALYVGLRKQPSSER